MNFILTELQRNSLIEYLQEQPFKEVAGAIQFLMNLPVANIVNDNKSQ